MRTCSHPTRLGRRRLAGGLPLALLVASITVPALAAAPDPSGDQPAPACPADLPAGAAAAAATESEALALAEACQAPVEVTAARGYAQRTWAQPSGSLRSELYAEPRWAREQDGEWVDVDPSLRWAPDGSVWPVATVSALRLSGGGDAPFVTATDPGGGSLSLSWPDPLPEPTLAGDTATYPQVYPGVDLAVTAGVDGFSYRLVVHTRAAAANPALARVEVGVAGDGLAVRQDPHGRVAAVDAAGEPVFTAGSAAMWDASQAGPGPAGLTATDAPAATDAPPGRMAQLPVELTGGGAGFQRLAVVPDPAMLADPDTEFPVVIDPPFVGRRVKWATVHREQPNRGWTGDSSWPRAGGMRIGLCTWTTPRHCGDAWGLWRSVVKFDTGALAGRYIQSAAVKMTQTHTGGCGGPYPLKLYRVSSFDSGVSWNGVNWLSHVQTKDVPRSNCGSGSRAIAFGGSGVVSRVGQAARNGYQTMSFGLRSGNESSRDQWRRVSYSHETLRLEVEHASYPQTPTNRSTDGKGCDTSAPGPWLTTGRPVLSARPRNDDGTGKLRLRIREDGSSSDDYRHTTGVITVNRTVSHRIPSADRLADGRYRWSARTVSPISAVPASPYSSWCYFRVDTTPPPAPSAAQLTDDPQLGDPVQFRLTGSPDTARFRYALTGGSSRTVTASGGTATITVDPPDTSIDHQLQVWARDAAGNESARHDMWFTTDKDLRVPVAGVWRFDGDWRDDSGNAHTLSPQSGVSPAADRQGRPGSAVHLDGESCAFTAGPVLHTDQSFTVAAWARPVPGTSRDTVVAQAGTDQTAFRLRTATNGRWSMMITSENSDTPVWQHALADAEATGDWQHVAGVYDAPAGRVRLYVDGVLASVAEVTSAWDAAGPLTVGCAAQQGSSGWDEFAGDLDEVVAYQGVLTSARIAELMAGGPPAGPVSWWPLRGDGADAGPAGQDLTVPPGASYVPDQHGRAGSALWLDGSTCATTTGSVLRSDDSFTVAAWARPGDDGTSKLTLLSQSGDEATVMRLRRGNDNRWGFVVMGADELDPVWYRAYAPAEATTGGWQHVAGVYDAAAGQIRVYVDGVEQAVQDAPEVLWRSSGATRLGCSGADRGNWDHFVGAVHDVRLWRGAATPEQLAAVATERVSGWGMDGSGLDVWGGNDLSLVGNYEWVEDRFGFPESAFGLGLDGTGWGETAGPVVATDESFTVSAWVRLADKAGHRTVVAQAGSQAPGFYLQYHPGLDRWQFAMPATDSASTSWHRALSDAAPQIGHWYHLAGVYDLGADRLSLYVNGHLQQEEGTVAGPAAPWSAGGGLLVGTAGDLTRGTYSPLVGAVDMVRVYTGVLDRRRIADQGIVPTTIGTLRREAS